MGETKHNDLEEAIRLAEVGEYLYNACYYNYGDGYSEPREYGIEWQWQQSKPDEYGQGQLLAASTRWHSEQAEDGTQTEATKLRSALASHTSALAERDAEIARLRAVALDMQAAYVEATDRAEEAVKASNALQVEVDRFRAAPAQPAAEPYEPAALKELHALIEKMPKYDRGFSWESSDWQGNEAIRAYNANARVLKFILDNTDAVISDLRSALAAPAHVAAEANVNKTIDALVDRAEVEWSYHEDNHRYPRDFWHARISFLVSTGKFKRGDRVRKIKGSSWQGRVVGFYSTSLTQIGYCVESEREPGSVQIYPESALASETEGGHHE